MTTPNPNPADDEAVRYANLPRRDAATLLMSIMVVALCGIVYELIIGTVSSYLLGNSVQQFSITIGFFMFAMGVGSYLSRFIYGNLIQAFIYVELALALVGGLCSVTLFMIFPFSPWMYQTAMFGFILVIGIFVGLEIPLLTRVLAEVKGTRKSIADVMSLDYVGALIGSVAFPLLLLPGLGLVTSSFAIGLVNAAVALLNVIWLRAHLTNFRNLLIAVALIFATLIALTGAASRITAFAQQHLYFDRVIWNDQTPYQTIVVTNDWPRGDLRLYIDGHLQFSESDEYRYHEALVHPVMSWSAERKKVLILGGGDGLAVREVLKYDDVERIDLVDIDPTMTWLGGEFAPIVSLNNNSLASPKVHIHNQDAFIYVRETTQQYDRVIIDFPDPHNEAISKLYSVEFYALLAHKMAPDGVAVSQSSSPFFAHRTFWSIGETMGAIFNQTLAYSVTIPSFGLWGFHLAFKGAPAGRREIPGDLHFLNDDVFRAAQVFGPDVAKPGDLTVNSIFQPDLYAIYRDDLARDR